MPKSRKSGMRGGREGVQTYCCDKKESKIPVQGAVSSLSKIVVDDNVGSNCEPSESGQCNIGYGTGQNYKFRCFNAKETGHRDIIESNKYTAKPGEEKCEYVTGMLSKVGKAVVAPVATGAVVTGTVLYPLARGTPLLKGGKRKTKRQTNKKRRTNKKHR